MTVADLHSIKLKQMEKYFIMVWTAPGREMVVDDPP
jgi:hypothetical protein